LLQRWSCFFIQPNRNKESGTTASCIAFSFRNDKNLISSDWAMRTTINHGFPSFKWVKGFTKTHRAVYLFFVSKYRTWKPFSFTLLRYITITGETSPLYSHTCNKHLPLHTYYSRKPIKTSPLYSDTCNKHLPLHTYYSRKPIKPDTSSACLLKLCGTHLHRRHILPFPFHFQYLHLPSKHTWGEDQSHIVCNRKTTYIPFPHSHRNRMHCV